MALGQGPSSSVLIVDDDELMRRLTRRILEGAGYTVWEAGSVHAALTMASTNSPHLVVFDLVLPQEDGFVFLAARQANPKLARIPVIVLSGASDLEAAHQAVALGADEFLSKPVEAAQLLRKARKRLRDRSFLTAEFGPHAPTVTVALPATVVSANVSQCAVSVSARVAHDVEGTAGVRLRDWDLVTQAGASCGQLRRSRQPSRSIGRSRYLASFNLVGLTAEQSARLSKLLGSEP